MTEPNGQGICWAPGDQTAPQCCSAGSRAPEGVAVLTPALSWLRAGFRISGSDLVIPVPWILSGCRSQRPGSAQQGLFLSCPGKSEAAQSPGAGVVTARGSSARLFLSSVLCGPRRVAAPPPSPPVFPAGRRRRDRRAGWEARSPPPPSVPRRQSNGLPGAPAQCPSVTRPWPGAGHPWLQGSRGSEAF